VAKRCRGDEFTEMTREAWPGTLAGSVIVDVEDRAREIESRLGFRPYTVHVVRVRFAGGRRGDGPSEVVQDVPILPVPDIFGLDGVTRVVTAAQVLEQGSITVAGISGRYTERHLEGRAEDGSPPSSAERTFWEVTFLIGDDTCPAGQRRRFQVVGVPGYNASKGAWSVTLERAQQDRTREGQPR
jgi:hypothetical protein